MSRLIERYPQVRRLPSLDSSVDDSALLKLLEPYLGWVLAEIDTASIDILICDFNTPSNGHPPHMVLLTGRAVAVWLRHAVSNADTTNPGDAPAE